MTTSWFYVEGNEKVGPINEDLLINLIQDQKLNENTYVWKKGYVNWTKLKESSELNGFLAKGEVREEIPSFDSMILEEEAPQQSSAFNWESVSRDEKLFSVKNGPEGDIYGPYSLNTLSRLYSENRLNGKSLIFTPAMESWCMLADIPQYEELFSDIPPSIDEMERKLTHRKPFVAKIFTHGQSHGFEGICRDISIGGLQVLVADFPAKKGDPVNLEVHPRNGQNHFEAKGIVGRVLDGGQGVFIRFNNLEDDSKNAIRTFLEEDH